MSTLVKAKEHIRRELDRLPPDLVREVVDFVEFLRDRKKTTRWVEFDAWAMNLAKKKRFNRLTEKEIAGIVKSFRKAVS